MKRVASIDIGTNTILMLITGIDSSFEGFRIIDQFFSTPRLGVGVDHNKTISSDAITRAEVILENYKKQCESNNVDIIIVAATSAMRDAENATFVKSKFENILNTKVNVITGDEEAYLSYLGSVVTLEKSILIDIGGGSTEIITGENHKILQRKSFQMGAVRITERIFKSKFPLTNDLFDEAEHVILDNLKEFEICQNLSEIYAVAGTPCSIATAINGFHDYEVEKIDGTRLYLTDIESLLFEFRKMTPAEITSKYLINAKRADIISAGALILCTILRYFKLEYTIVSAKGLRYGLIKDYVLKNK